MKNRLQELDQSSTVGRKCFGFVLRGIKTQEVICSVELNLPGEMILIDDSSLTKTNRPRTTLLVSNGTGERFITACRYVPIPQGIDLCMQHLTRCGCYGCAHSEHMSAIVHEDAASLCADLCFTTLSWTAGV